MQTFSLKASWGYFCIGTFKATEKNCPIATKEVLIEISGKFPGYQSIGIGIDHINRINPATCMCLS
jgi:hypothetical protein